MTAKTNAAVSQKRKGTTATQRNRASEAINQIVKKVKGEGESELLLNP